MAKFADVEKIKQGKRARSPITIEMGSAGLQKLDVRALDGAEEARVLAGALKYAKENGVEDAGFGDPLYDLGVQLHTILLACVDSDAKDEVPYFESLEQLTKSDLLTRDHFAIIYEAQQVHQDEVSPYDRDVSPDNLIDWASKIAGGDQLPFVGMRPGARWSFTRSLAIRWLSLRAAKSLSSPPSEEKTLDETTTDETKAH